MTSLSREPALGGRRAAFFDMDLTVLRVDSGINWMRYLRARGELSRFEMARAVYWSLLYKLALLDMDTLADRMVAKLGGTLESELVEKARQFYEEWIAHQVAPGALTAIAQHRAAGDRIVLLTASTQYLAETVGGSLNMDHTLCSRLDVRDGSFTGGLALRCFGHHKVHVAEAFAQAHGVDLSQSSFYSDSYNDMPMLARVGEPVAVNPDTRLLRHARKRGWRIEHWKRS